MLPPPDGYSMYRHPTPRERLIHAALVRALRRCRITAVRVAPRAPELPARLHLPILHSLDVPPSADAHDVPRELPQHVDVVRVEVAVEDEQDREDPGTQVGGVWVGRGVGFGFDAGIEIGTMGAFQVHDGVVALRVERQLVRQAVDVAREVV